MPKVIADVSSIPASLPKAVAEVDDAAAESVLVDELEIGAGRSAMRGCARRG